MSEVWVKRSPKGPVTMRLAAKEDFAAIIDIDNLVSKANKWFPLIDTHLSDYINKKQVYVAVFNGEIIGFAIYYDKDEARYYVRAAVLHNFRGLKIYSAFVLLRMLKSRKRVFVPLLEPHSLLSEIAERLRFNIEKSESNIKFLLVDHDFSVKIRIPDSVSSDYADNSILQLLKEDGWHPTD
ncbi:TPA: GNAT family N-acetyltransferase [archaeon]|uniref:GNAT family N-acetyltransferase n=1 Tax=Candidatus Naiadarchaeum limnaeum TaxID=2756139 RepID=A0A832UN62_9ARCH|nr:GNAT family N-acetyltransferase [Candidatus Naiadarchaeales archaeon SRR2090153.bin1042]HIK00269.1 GNAT family N-acetyltransferase [Candidatus Naiadarchaeum limnaeum]